MVFADYLPLGFKVFFMAFFIFLFIIILNKNKIVNIFDPFIYQTLVISFALSGMIAVGILFMNNNFLFFTITMFVLFISLSVVGNVNKKNININLYIPEDLQIMYMLILLSIVVIDLLVNLILPWHIPLLIGYSADVRVAASTNSRLLVYLSSSVGALPIVFLALSDSKRVRRIALITIILVLFKSVLMLSRGVVLNIVVLFSIYYFLKSLKFMNKTSFFAYLERKKIKSAKYKLFTYLMLASLLTPVYMHFIANGSKVLFIFERLFRGFDNLIFTIVYDINIDKVMEKFNMNMIDLYFMPFFKVLFGAKYEFNSVTEYILYDVFHITEKQAFPNSNLMLELVMTEGFVVAFVSTIIIYMYMMLVRKRLIYKKRINLFNAILLYYFVVAPFDFFMFGYQEFLRILVSFLIYVFVVLLYTILPKKTKVTRIEV